MALAEQGTMLYDFKLDGPCRTGHLDFWLHSIGDLGEKHKNKKNIRHALVFAIDCDIEVRELTFQHFCLISIELRIFLPLLKMLTALVIVSKAIRSFMYRRLANHHSHLLCRSCQSTGPRAALQASQLRPSSMWYIFRFCIAPWTLVVIQLFLIDWYDSRISGTRKALPGTETL